jgi:hypothetical protein
MSTSSSKNSNTEKVKKLGREATIAVVSGATGCLVGAFFDWLVKLF